MNPQLQYNTIIEVGPEFYEHMEEESNYQKNFIEEITFELCLEN